MNLISLACLIIGYLLVVAGFTLMYHPFGLIVAGLGAIYVALRSRKQ